MQQENHLVSKRFENLDIAVYGTYEEPLFKANDIGELLGISQIRKTIQNLDESCKILKAGNSITTGLQYQWFLTEDGLYEVLFISRKPIAKSFKKWVRNIIKEVRLNGKYEIQENEKKVIEQQSKSNTLIEHYNTKRIVYLGKNKRFSFGWKSMYFNKKCFTFH